MNERGIGIIEAIALTFIAVLLLFFVFRQISGVQKAQSKSAQRLMLKQLVDMEYSRLKGQSSSFPPIVDGATPLVYVRCFSRNGAPAANSAGKMSYFLIGMADPKKISAGFCAGTDFELHIVPTDNPPHTAQIHAFALLGKTVSEFDFHLDVAFEPGI